MTSSLNIAMKALDNEIEVAREKFDYAARYVERIEEELKVAVENAAEKKRDLDLKMDEKRKMRRMILGSIAADSRNMNKKNNASGH